MKINLLPVQYRPQPQVTFTNLVILLAGVILILGVGFLAVNEFLQHQWLTAESERYRTQLDSYQQSLVEFDKFQLIKRQIETKQAEVRKISDSYQPLALILRAVAAEVPENVWLTRFTVTPDGKLTIEGRAMLFSLVGDFQNNLNDLPIIQASKVRSFSQSEKQYLFNLELQTVKEPRNNGQN